jgi:hemerythrin-like domain-containing protein
MLEHGIIRRILPIYAETAKKLHNNEFQAINTQALHTSAKLFSTFINGWHEEIEEEQYVFPFVRKIDDELANIVDILIAQHKMSKKAVNYILAATNSRITSKNAEKLALTIEKLVRMYAEHGAREDTTVFVAWRKTLSADDFKNVEETWEKLENEHFGGDGFERAMKIVEKFEQDMGYSDLSQFNI